MPRFETQLLDYAIEVTRFALQERIGFDNRLSTEQLDCLIIQLLGEKLSDLVKSIPEDTIQEWMNE